MLDALGLTFLRILLCRSTISFFWAVVKLDKETPVIICCPDLESSLGTTNLLREFHVLRLPLVGTGLPRFKFVGCIFCLLTWEFALSGLGNKFLGGALVENVECCRFLRWWLFPKFPLAALPCTFLGWVSLVAQVITSGKLHWQTSAESTTEIHSKQRMFAALHCQFKNYFTSHSIWFLSKEKYIPASSGLFFKVKKYFNQLCFLKRLQFCLEF